MFAFKQIALKHVETLAACTNN